VLEGQALTIRWNVGNVNGVVIEPLGNQAASGEIPYSALTVGSKTFTLKAENVTQPLQSSIELIVKAPTPTPTDTPTPTSTSTPTPTQTPTITQTPTPTFTPSITNTAFIITKVFLTPFFITPGPIFLGTP
jgi:hypothetical protein